jgi:hypothetical protein
MAIYQISGAAWYMQGLGKTNHQISFALFMELSSMEIATRGWWWDGNI